ncbi:protein ALP1-like [Rhagoletis pomonella]|uniref:protein ALP1-like n=1 Tax=Rhagoletis pomonella TaxID=28610 RepID=UPI00178749DC|nr:protein ALP1-like [Rhagoletis pomonella]
MQPETFDELFDILEPHLRRKRNTRPRDSIPEKAKLAIVLEYVIYDIKYSTWHIASCYRISQQHFGKIITKVCSAIVEAFKTEIPEWSEDNLKKFSDGFSDVWNFPNCVAAIDGKHVVIKAPRKSGSVFFNYKGFYSVVLLATCDAVYKFTYVDVGAYGSEGDSNIFNNSKFGERILSDRCLFPSDTTIMGKRVPFFMVGDDAFPLCKRIMKPYSAKPLSPDERIFNYRLSRARRCIENAFGILSARWLCLRKVLFCSPDRAQIIIIACCLLHNFLLRKSQSYCDNNFSGFEDTNRIWVHGEWEPLILGDSFIQSNLPAFRGRATDYGKFIRNILKEYVNSESGSVPWQNSAAFV